MKNFHYIFCYFVLLSLGSGNATAWISGVTDSTGNKNVGSSTLDWDVGSFSTCNAPAVSCGTSSGSQSRSITCLASNLDGVTDSTVANSFCQSVVSSIGSEPASSQSCSQSWGACPPTPPPFVIPDLSGIDWGALLAGLNGGSYTPPPQAAPPAVNTNMGNCTYSARVCNLYFNVLDRAPDHEGATYWENDPVFNSQTGTDQTDIFIGGIEADNDSDVAACQQTGFC